MLLKDFHQPMTLETMVTACALSGYFRTYGFKMILAQPETCTSGLGQHRDYEARGIPEQHPNVFRINVNDVWDKDAAERKALEIAELLSE